jgi:orotate phosphoribosyltransferase
VQEVARDYNLPVVSIVSLADVLEYLQEIGGHEEHVSNIQRYRQEYGI